MTTGLSFKLYGDTKQASLSVDDIKDKLRELTDKRHDIRINADDREASIHLQDLSLKMDKLDRKVARPHVSSEGLQRANLEADKLLLKMDDLNKKSGRSGGFLSRIFGSGSSSIARRSGDVSGEGGGLLENPIGAAGIGGGVGILAALLPSLVGLTAGAGIGGLGAIGAISKSKGLQSAGSNILTQLLKTTSGIAGTPAFKSPTSMSITPATGLYAIFSKLSVLVQQLSPEMQRMFSASMPFLNMFVNVLGQATKALMPSLVTLLKEMVSSGALKEMTQGFILLITDGVVPFLKVLGPGLKASSVVFKASILALDGVLVGLGAGSMLIARELAILGNNVNDVGKIFYDIGRVIAALLTGNWRAMDNAVAAMGNNFRNFLATIVDALDGGFMKISSFAHDAASIFDKSRHELASIWDATWSYIGNQLRGSADDDMSILKSWFHGIEGGFDSLRHSVASAWDNMWNDVKSLTRSAVSAVKGIANGLENAFETPVRFVIDNVWDKLAGLWNRIEGIVHVGFKLPVVTMATGGRIPGYGGGDQIPALLERGEVVVDKDRSRALAPVFRAAGVPGFAGGGLVGGIGSFFSGLGKDLISWVSKPAAFIEQHIFGSVTSMLGSLGSTGLGETLRTLVVDIIKSLTGQLHNAGSVAYGGPASPGLAEVAKYLMAHGASRAAAAGIAGTVAGESGGNPESVGSGGAGLIGWTPPGSAYPILPLVTGNSGRDMGVQLVDMLAYINRNGGMGRLNAAGDPMDAAWLFSAAYERPLVTGSDIRANVVKSLYARGLANGGWLTEPIIGRGMHTGTMYTLGENEAEYVTPASRMRGGGGDTYIINVQGDTDPDAAALRIIKEVRRYKKRHGNQGTGIG